METVDMSILDIIIGVFLFWGLYKGFTNGLFIELATLAALVAGIFGAIHFSYIAEDYLNTKMDWEAKYISLLAFIITFAAIVVGVHWIGKLLTKAADFALLGGLNKIAGALFGALKFAIIIGALLVFFHKSLISWGWVDQSVVANSILYEPIKLIGQEVFSAVLKETE